jgi:hypothetical protein
MPMRKAHLVLLLAAVAVALAGYLLFLPLIADRAATSPDGAFIAQTTVAPIMLLIPVMPGQGGDKPGRVTVYGKDGRSCGSAALDMVSMVSAIRWRLDARPRRAELIAVAAWDLDACRLIVPYP